MLNAAECCQSWLKLNSIKFNFKTINVVATPPQLYWHQHVTSVSWSRHAHGSTSVFSSLPYLSQCAKFTHGCISAAAVSESINMTSCHRETRREEELCFDPDVAEIGLRLNNFRGNVFVYKSGCKDVVMTTFWPGCFRKLISSLPPFLDNNLYLNRLICRMLTAIE